LIGGALTSYKYTFIINLPFTTFLFTLQCMFQTAYFPKTFRMLYKHEDKERCTGYQSNVTLTYIEQKKRAVIHSVFRFYHLVSLMNNNTSLGQANMKATSLFED